MAMKRSAFAGAAVAQVMYLAVDIPSFRAMWSWTMSVPEDMKFSCTEGKQIGGGQGTTADDFKCTVSAKSGYTCDVAEIDVVCSDPVQDFANEVPVEVMCLNVGHKAGQADNDNTSSLSWSQVPQCRRKGFTLRGGHACRKDAEGTDAGVEGTDYIKLDQADGGVRNVAHCDEICAKYEETNGQACHGIEYTHGEDSTIDYCEIWLVKPEGTTVSETHNCDLYVKPAAHDDHSGHDHDHDHDTPGVGAAEVTTAAPNTDVSSSSILKWGVVSFVSAIWVV